MLFFLLYSRPPSKSSIKPFKNFVVDIIKIGRAFVEVQKYIDILL